MVSQEYRCSLDVEGDADAGAKENSRKNAK
jgi:hypothetical protein